MFTTLNTAILAFTAINL